MQLHPNVCTPEWDLPGMGSDCNKEWYSGSVHFFRNLVIYSVIHKRVGFFVNARRLPTDTCLVSKKFYKSPLTNYDFGVAIGGLLLKLQNFKNVQLIFGHPVS